jgi:hypothetical protein
MTGVENIINHQDVAILKIWQQNFRDHHLVPRFIRRAEPARLHESNSQRHLQLANQISEQYEAAGEDRNDRNRPTLVDSFHLFRQLAHAFGDLIGVEKFFHALFRPRCQWVAILRGKRQGH